MTRRGRSLLYVLIVAALLSACSLSETPESTLPAGVYSDGTQNYYAVELAGGESLSDYFTLTGVQNKILFNTTTLGDQSSDLGIVYYCTVDDGGVVAYKADKTGLFLYFPATFASGEIKNACALLAMGRIEKTMSIDEAQNYIPGLAS